jgi:hypothetical protein
MNDIEEYLSREKLNNIFCCGTSRISNKTFLNKITETRVRI